MTIDSDALPTSWRSATFAEIFHRFQYGYTASADASLRDGSRFLRITDIDNDGRVAWERVPGCSITKEDMRKYALSDGDFVFARTGSTEKAAFITNPPPSVFASYLIRGKSVDPGVAPWVEKYLKSGHYLGQIGALGAGIGRENVNAEKLASIEIPLAPITEQHRIVAKLVALQSRTRLAREALAAIPTLIDHYRQSVLAAAFRGELSAGWRTGSTDVSLDAGAIDDLRCAARATLGLRAQAPTEALTADLPEVPSSWSILSLDRLSVFVTDGTHQPPPTQGTGVPFLMIGCLKSGRINWDSVSKWVSVETARLLTDRYSIEAGDVLYAAVGATYGQAVIVDRDAPFIFQRHIAHIKPLRSVIVPAYLNLILNSPVIFDLATREARGAAQPTVTLGSLRGYPIPLPPLAEQKYISNMVDRAFRRIQELELRCSEMLAGNIRLDQSLLATAFRGELVPQDPADEPASVLLDRIRAARAQAGDTPHQRRPRASAEPPPTRAAEPVTPYRVTPGGPYTKLVAALRANGNLASSDAQAVTGLDAAGVRSLLQRLVTEGIAKVEGQKRGTRYVAV